MRIRILGDVVNARGAFTRGKVVEWPDQDAQPLIDAGVAEVASEPAAMAPRSVGEEDGA